MNTTQAITVTSGKVTDGGLSILNEKIAAFNRRATRLGLPLMAVVVEGVEIETRTQPVTELTYTVKYNVVKVIGSVPRINGWEVAARVEFTEAGNLVHVAPGIEGVNPAWRTVGNVCQHCNSKRRRNDLVVIRHESGEEKIVGRNCLADYIRTTNAEGLIAYAVSLSEFGLLVTSSENEFWGKGGGRGEYAESLDNVLKFASVCIRKLGWVSGSAARNDFTGCLQSTADAVRKLLFVPSNSQAYEAWENWVRSNDLHAAAFDAEEMDLAKAWLATLDDATVRDSEYLHNLRVIRDLGYVEYSKMGYAVSIIIAAKKARDEAINRAEFAKKNADKGFVGTVGERMRNVPVTVKRVRSIDGNYGVKTIITFENEGNELTWFASGDRCEEYREGSNHVVDATVKEHKDHERFGKSTIVNRVTAKAS